MIQPHLNSEVTPNSFERMSRLVRQLLKERHILQEGFNSLLDKLLFPGNIGKQELIDIIQETLKKSQDD
jgi:hypothetical protein